jgi:sucrose-6F-phosphate phosphohydrolase
MMKFLLVTDLDNTLVGDEEATEALNQALRARREQFCLVYATGRSYPSARQLKAEAQLLEPDYWIASVGSEIYHQGEVDPRWAQYLSQGWNREAVWAIARRFSALAPQPQSEQNPGKASFWLERSADFSVIDQLQAELHRAKLAVQVIFSSGRDVDLLPRRGNKGKAAAYLRERLQVRPENTLVCGDSGNDISLFKQPANGAIVNNAQPELLRWYYEHRHPWHYLARSPYAGGILEALEHFNFLTSGAEAGNGGRVADVVAFGE